VTQDVHRLIRLGNSLNGKTGLRAQMINPNDLDDFDPMWSAVALPIDEEAHVKVIRSGGIRLRGLEIPPISRSIVKLPLAAAVLLLCRGVATLP
jgi:DNA primase small subunit